MTYGIIDIPQEIQRFSISYDDAYGSSRINMNCMGVPVAPLWVYVKYTIIDLLSNRYLDKVQGSKFKTSASFKACDGGGPDLIIRGLQRAPAPKSSKAFSR